MNCGPPVLALIAAFVLAEPLDAQSASYVVGRVLDPSDAVVPGASITVVNQDSGFRRVTETGLDGAYLVSSLENGLYKITVRKQGFIGMLRFDVKVGAFRPARADFKLSVGAVQETITVEGASALVTAEDASIGVRLFQDDIRRVPLNGKGVLGLM